LWAWMNKAYPLVCCWLKANMTVKNAPMLKSSINESKIQRKGLSPMVKTVWEWAETQNIYRTEKNAGREKRPIDPQAEFPYITHGRQRSGIYQPSSFCYQPIIRVCGLSFYSLDYLEASYQREQALWFEEAETRVENLAISFILWGISCADMLTRSKQGVSMRRKRACLRRYVWEKKTRSRSDLLGEHEAEVAGSCSG